MLFPWSKADVVAHFRLPKPCTDSNTQTHRHTDTLSPSHREFWIRIRLDPVQRREEASRYIPVRSFFSQSRLFPHVLPSGRIPHPDGSPSSEGRKESRANPKRKSRIKRGCMMCCQEYMRVASSDIPILRCRQAPFLSECSTLTVCVTPTGGGHRGVPPNNDRERA